RSPAMDGAMQPAVPPFPARGKPVIGWVELGRTLPVPTSGRLFSTRSPERCAQPVFARSGRPTSLRRRFAAPHLRPAATCSSRVHKTALRRYELMILVTGGAGYIGSHAVLELLLAGEEVLVLDNLCNSSKTALDRVAQLSGRAPQFIKGDVRNRALLQALFASYPIRAVMHFAGLKAVGESVREPLRYYETNVSGSITLCQAMAEAGVFRLVFSSSAT